MTKNEVLVDGEAVRMTPIEYNILLLLMKNPGRVFYHHTDLREHLE